MIIYEMREGITPVIDMHKHPIHDLANLLIPASGAEPETVRAATLERLASFQRRYTQQGVHVDGRRWLYRRTLAERRDRTPLVLLPGIQGSGDVFFELVLEVGADIPLISVTAPDIADIAEMVAATCAFLDHLDLQRVHLLGSSLGGYLAQAIVLARPDRIGQLIVANGFYDPAPFLAMQPPATAIAAADPKQLAEKNLDRLHDGPDADAGQISLAAAMQALVEPVQSFENYKSRLLLLARAASLARARIGDERVMLIDNDRDPLILPAMREALRRRYATSERHTLDDGGHLPAIQRPCAFADLVRRRMVSEYSSRDILTGE